MDGLGGHSSHAQPPLEDEQVQFEIPGSDATDFSRVMNGLTEAVRQMGTNHRVPPPAVFSGTSGMDVVSFFDAFERYACSVYGMDYMSWMVAISTYLEGEPRALVEAFGPGASYRVVKNRLVSEYTARSSTLGNNEISAFFSASRLPNESLLCFSIRLERLAGRVSSAKGGAQNLMVKSKFLSCLPPALVNQISLQLSTIADPSVSQVVKLACMLESQFTVPSLENYLGAVAPVIQEVGGRTRVMESYRRGDLKCRGCGKEGHLVKDCFKGKSKCFKCGELGHFARECIEARDQQQHANRSNYTMCNFCGENGHMLKDCPEFLKVLACAWCGSNDHKSHNCDNKPVSSRQGNWRRSEQ